MTLDPVRETFVQEYRSHGNASEAYRTAKPRAKKWKPETVHVKACHMLAEDKVQTRLSQLQRKSAEKHNITIERLTEMTITAYETAKIKGNATGQAQSAAMVKAAEFLGKLHGLIVERQEVSGKDGAPLTPVINVTVARD